MKKDKPKQLTTKDQLTEFLLYTAPSGEIKIEVFLQNETVRLTQKAMTELFKTTKQNISLHLNNIFEEGELIEPSVVKDFLTTASDGKKYRTKYYNLDAIISVGYRIKSQVATQFRIWATKILKEYITKGFALNDERFKTGNSMNYFNELQERIREFAFLNVFSTRKSRTSIQPVLITILKMT